MLSIPPHILLIGTLIAWIGLMVSWSRYINDAAETRRMAATKKGETPPDMKGASNYARADIRERAHRDSKITPMERWIGRGLGFVLPVIILAVFMSNVSL